jgi:tRNA nucleotidyltransferase/poly(A) polymerase
MGNARIHPILKEVAAVFTRRGKKVYLVGGAVRDLLRGEKARDWDLATDARPEEVIAFFREKGPVPGAAGKGGGKPLGFVIPTGIKHGTVTVHYRGYALEVTTFRTESDYRDGRRPEKVEFAAAVEEDLSRRDFTMNAAALSLPEGVLIDPFGGAADIGRRLIRCVGKPGERFSEDGLRPLRAVRFAAQLGFRVDEAVLAAIAPALPVTAKVSPERIRDELDRILRSPKPSAAFRLMEKTGLLGLILPELAACRGVEQKGFHRFDVLDHSLLACDYAAAEGFPGEVILAALLHDTGKALTRRLNEAGIWTFYRHETESVRLSRDILTRLRYPNGVINAVCHLIGEHMFHYEETWSGAAVRRFIIRVGRENLENLYRLRRADAYGMAGIEPAADFLLSLVNRVDEALAGSRVFSLRDLAVSGRDLIAAGIPPGRQLGIILKELLETVVEDPAMNSREKLLETAVNISRRRL